MQHRHHPAIVLAIFAGLMFSAAPASADRHRPKPATAADIERIEKKIEEQQRVIDKLVKLQQLYQHAFGSIFEGVTPTASPSIDKPPAMLDKPAPGVTPPPIEKKKAEAKPRIAVEPRPVAERKKPKRPEGNGTIVGRVEGVPNAIVYVEDIVTSSRGTAAMKQQGKQFVPQVLVVPKGTNVAFPNADAVFHNVFSVTPSNSFDLGSYKQGESRSVAMNRPGVVTVYCNMHPQMVGHILVVPNGNYARAGKDGFFRLQNVPPGSHRVVAWAPNAKPTVVQTTVEPEQVVTIEMNLVRGRFTQHVKKDGLPYGSYEK